MKDELYTCFNISVLCTQCLTYVCSYGTDKVPLKLTTVT